MIESGFVVIAIEWAIWAAAYKLGVIHVPPRLLAMLSLIYTISAVSNLASGCPQTGVILGGEAGWFAWLAWKHRNPRHRKPSRVAARIRDLGHRLVVSPS